MRRINIKKIIIILFGILYIIIFISNYCKDNMKNISERENRTLATLPQFSFKSITNGKYFEGIDLYIQDHFFMRDKLIDAKYKINEMIDINNYIKKSKLKIDNANNESNISNDEYDISTVSTISTKSSIRKFTNYDLEYIGNGYMLNDGIPYVKGNWNNALIGPYLESLKLTKEAFKDTDITIIPVPQSALLIEDIHEFYLKNQSDEAEVFKKAVMRYANSLNIPIALKKHLNEPIFFTYDHHWTHLGAYYAYEEFCKSKNYDYPSLDSFEKVNVTNDFEGSTYHFTLDERLKGKREPIDVYMPKYENKLTVIHGDGARGVYDNCIDLRSISYAGVFSKGDKPYEEIVVTGNGMEGKNALVIKDSEGCAFIPYLTNNYEKIYVVDPRHANFNIVKLFSETKLEDIIFVHSSYETYSTSFANDLNKILTYSE